MHSNDSDASIWYKPCDSCGKDIMIERQNKYSGAVCEGWFCRPCYRQHQEIYKSNRGVGGSSTTDSIWCDQTGTTLTYTTPTTAYVPSLEMQEYLNQYAAYRRPAKTEPPKKSKFRWPEFGRKKRGV